MIRTKDKVLANGGVYTDLNPNDLGIESDKDNYCYLYDFNFEYMNGHEFTYIIPKSQFTDEELIYLTDHPEENITNSTRLEFGRWLILNYANDELCTTVHPYRINLCDEVLLCFKVDILGQSGPAWTLIGAFHSVEVFKSWLEKNYIIFGEPNEVTDRQILNCWE